MALRAMSGNKRAAVGNADEFEGETHSWPLRRWRQNQPECSQTLFDSRHSERYFFLGTASASTAGYELTSVKAISGGLTPLRLAFTSISIARPVLAGTTTLSFKILLRTPVWPVLGSPSQPGKSKPSPPTFPWGDPSALTPLP